MFLPSLLDISIISHFATLRTHIQEASFSWLVTCTAYLECQSMGNQPFWDRMGCRTHLRRSNLIHVLSFLLFSFRVQNKGRVLRSLHLISFLYGQESEVTCPKSHGSVVAEMRRETRASES